MKIEHIIKHSDSGHFYYVFDKIEPLVYKQFDDLIIGSNGVLVSFLYYEKSLYAQAFAGREFKIELENGEVVLCKGDWWDGFNTLKHSAIILKELNISGMQELCSVSCETEESLRKCFVFSGYTGIRSQILKLESLRFYNCAEGIKFLDYDEYCENLRIKN